MVFNVGDGDDEIVEAHEINVTPFIDVMLVLLIIFMVAAPLATVDVKVDLPVADGGSSPRPDKPLFLTLRADRQLLFGDMPVADATLGPALDRATNKDREQRVFLRADQSVAYGAVMQVMNGLRAAGYLHVALVGLDGGHTSP